MANTLTNLIPDIYLSLDVVSREMTGLIPAVTMDPQAARAALNQTIYADVAPAATATDITPAVTPPDDGDQTIGSVSMSITKSRRVPFRWNGEQSRSVNAPGGLGVANIRMGQLQQAIRTLVNEIEADLAALYAKASRAYGTAGTTPFATAGDYTDASMVRKILADNGAPLSDLQLVVDSAAGATLRGKQADANRQGDDSMLRQGVLLDFSGMAVRESAQIKAHTKGTAAGYLVDLVAGYAAGSTTIHVDTGTGTMLSGDILTNSQSGRDSNKYVVKTGHAGDGDQDVVLQNPGTLAAWVDGDTIAIGANYRANMAFARSAIVLATRAPALPDGGDMADDRMLITDPRSGLTLEFSVYRQYRQVQYEVAVAWGVEVVKPEHLALLLG